jgi:protein involved in polysaccharide export with SLBB domain
MMIAVAIVAGLLWLVALDLRWSGRINRFDLIKVEVASALPGRPIKGERLVRPDGKITLGYYGDVQVAGLSADEARGKIVVHLRRYLADETLGLVRTVATADGGRSSVQVDACDTDRVSVWVDTKNSQTGVIPWICYQIRALPSRVWSE